MGCIRVYLEGFRGGYWRLESGLAVPAVAKRLEGNRGRTEAAGAELTVILESGGWGGG